MSLTLTHGMVLAAGLGSRMRPLTNDIPKPMVPVAGRRLIDYAFDQLAAQHIAHGVVNSSYLADKLEAYVSSLSLPFTLHISHEPERLETGGGIAQALAFLGRAPFCVLNSDTICVDLPGQVPALSRLAERWDDAAMDALLLLHPTEKALGYDGPGDFELLPEGYVQRRVANARAPYVFTGVQLLHPRLFSHAPSGAFSMNVLYDESRQPDGSLTRVHGMVHQGDWLHVGDPAGLAAAEAYLLNS